MKPVIKKILSPFNIFFALEASSGILLAICTFLALAIANSPFHETYHHLLETNLFGLSIHHWINDALMALFFFVVGLEIKRELISGELSSRKKASLPIAAALGGMIAPALIYYFFNTTYPNNKGWGIPMATDIAFALGVLSFFPRVPNSLKIFLLALAIVDDLGAVAVIALFYTQHISLPDLACVAALIVFILIAQRSRAASYGLYTLIGISIWFFTLRSGIHATVAGVVLGFLTPIKFRTRKGQTLEPLGHLVHHLHPWVSYGIMPIFALANAGVSLQGANFSAILSSSIFTGISAGLFLGKPLGITLMAWIFVKVKWAQLPAGVNWSQILALGFLGGIGFTMALFISNLALYPEQEIFSKTAILMASSAAGIMGSFLLWLFLPKGKIHANH